MFQVVFYESPNFDEGRDGEKPYAIVDHIMQSSIESARAWFKQTKNKARRVSAHYGVARDGHVEQYVDTENTAWANGIVQRPDLSIDWIRECVERGINPNKRTISIEHEGNTGEPLTEKQYLATLELHRQLIARYNIVVDDKHIIGHNRIDGKDRPFCPGKAYPFARLFADLNGTKPLSAFNPNPKNQKISPDSELLTLLANQGHIAETGEIYAESADKVFRASFVYTDENGLIAIAISGDGGASWDSQLYRALPKKN